MRADAAVLRITHNKYKNTVKIPSCCVSPTRPVPKLHLALGGKPVVADEGNLGVGHNRYDASVFGTVVLVTVMSKLLKKQ